MLVRCKINDLAHIADAQLRKRLQDDIHIDGPISDLSVGRDYPVQAIEARAGIFWFYLHSVDASAYPYPYPAAFFENVDGALPSGWSVAMTNEETQGIKRIAFPEWANDDQFYEKLVDRNTKCVAIYRKNRREMKPCVQHLAIRSTDPERLARFYEDVFGWTRIASSTGGVQMSDGHINIAILDLGDENGIDHFGVKLDSMDEVAAGLAKHNSAARPKPPGRAAEYGIKDPDGNRIDLSVRGFLRERV